MSTTDPEQDPIPPVPVSPPKANDAWKRLGWKLGIWAGFLVVIYVARDFFFTAFMTFLICFYTLALVNWTVNRISPDRDSLWLRRLVTIGIFGLVPLILLGIGVLLSPHVAAQGKRLSGWLRYASPETEAARLLEDIVGKFLFQSEYGNRGTPTYQEGLQAFLDKGDIHAMEYYNFPSLEGWVEGSIVIPIADEERERIRTWMLSEGTSSKSFTDWFINVRAPQLIAEAEREVPSKERPDASIEPLVIAAASSTPEQLLDKAHRDPAKLDVFRREWINDRLKNKFDEAITAPAYLDRLRKSFEIQRQQTPEKLPFAFDEYVELAKIRQQGRRAFGEAFEKIKPPPENETPAEKQLRLVADFEASKKHGLFQEWWSTNSVATFFRHQLQSIVDPNAASGHIESILGSLFNVPVALGTALTLSIFICIDFVNLKKSAAGLRKTWLRDVYDEMVPAMDDMGHLVGRFMQLQGLIALCSAVLTGIGLAFIGVEHVLLLSLATFILCLVPTLGSIFAIVLVVVFALFQYGGGLELAIEAGIVTILVSLFESFVLSPRILGKKMELHPVTIIIVLPLAQYFFGIWGLILATPVTVYVVNVLILQRGLPGTTEQHVTKDGIAHSGVHSPPGEQIGLE